MTNGKLTERRVTPANGFGMLALALLLLLLGGLGLLITAGVTEDEGWVFLGLPMVLVGFVWLFGLTVVNPNKGKVLLFFGEYRGSITTPGFYWVNPFTIRRNVSLRVHNFTGETLKVNDERGNPIEIAAVVVWKVENTVRAMLEVEDHLSYVAVQSEAALRQIASAHPYDDTEGGETSLRGSADVVNKELLAELQERLSLAGIRILEARLSHLAYAPEIAGDMLRRQQAEAIIAARQRIVDGAVGMVKMALDHLQEDKIVELDDDKRATMVSNLLVVLCSEQGTQPVVNTGTLYQ